MESQWSPMKSEKENINSPQNSPKHETLPSGKPNIAIDNGHL